MTGEEAIEILDRDFDTFDTARRGGDTDGRVSRGDLEAVAGNEDGNFTDEQERAAEVLLESDTYRNFLDMAAGRGGRDGVISRDDVDAAQDAISSGTHYDELLDTAAGIGRPDGVVGNDDFAAALADPHVPDELKDTLRVIQTDSTEGTVGAHEVLSELDRNEVGAISQLSNSPEYTALSTSDRALAADAIRDSGGQATGDVTTLLSSPGFQSGSAAEQTAQLSEIALLNSTEFQGLPAADQARIRASLGAADASDTTFATDLNALVKDPNFLSLDPVVQTSILAQVQNYPDSRSVRNLDRMVDRDWFQSDNNDDQQRSAKLIAHMSQDDGGDRTIIENTLDGFLASDDGFNLEWKDITSSPGSTTYGFASGDTLTLNRNAMAADNNPVGAADPENHLVEHTTAHEVSHLVNGDRYDQTFEYLNEEFRAWYVGFQAEHGRAPTNAESLERWEWFLNPNSAYGNAAHGSESWLPFGWGDVDGALDKPAEANQIYALLSTLSGVAVNAGNYQTVLADPTMWVNPNATAPDTFFPATDDLDN